MLQFSRLFSAIFWDIDLTNDLYFLDAAPPTTRERPPGCRTAFIGGLPENVTEEMIGEVFENFGAICSVRKGKKNFCHIRYEMEESVDRSLYLSGK